MVAQPHHNWTEAEYLAFERHSPTKHEYAAGLVYAMAGASRRHVLIVTNLVYTLSQQLRRRPCEIYATDMRVRTSPTSIFYPDVSVVCGEALFLDAGQDTLLNPTLIIEVLSPSTAAYDRGGKFQSYRLLPSLQAYVLVAQDAPHIAHYLRQPEGDWLLTEATALTDVLPLPAIGCGLALADVYDKVTFADPDPSDQA